MQATAHFVFWTIVAADADRLRAGLSDRSQVPGPRLLDHVILIPMMLSPAVVGNFWDFLYQPQIGLFNYAVTFFTGIRLSSR